MKKQNEPFILRIALNMLLNIKNPAKRDVFLAVYSFTNNGQGECFASQRRIAERSAYSKTTITKYLPQLVKDKLLKVVGRRPVKGGSINIYKFSGQFPTTKKPKAVGSRPKVVGKPKHKQLKETILQDKNYFQRKTKKHFFLDIKDELDNAQDWVEENHKEIKRPKQFFTNWLKKAANSHQQGDGGQNDWRSQISEA